MNRLFSQLLVGACFGALAEAGMAQTDTPPPAQPSGSAAATSKAHAKHSSSKHAQHHAHTKSTSHKKSTSQPTKSSGKANASTAAASPQESAYHQALRGCASEQNPAQRDSCLDGAIAKYQPNT
jgi:hypothetical protein